MLATSLYFVKLSRNKKDLNDVTVAPFLVFFSCWQLRKTQKTGAAVTLIRSFLFHDDFSWNKGNMFFTAFQRTCTIDHHRWSHTQKVVNAPWIKYLDLETRFDYYDFFRTNGASSCSMQHSRPTVKNQPQKKILRTLCTARPQFSASDLISVEFFGAGESNAINGLWKLSIAGCCLRRISLKKYEENLSNHLTQMAVL